ncbi:MAG: glycosyltransferase family 4 protein [Gemmatimonadetes bacterium]|nr:glycosyltransferase family 4 protein [Gemmatimonadota bacterium]
MDLRTEGRILYISDADVSVGYGPGVNENEFIHAMHEAVGDRADFLVPRPLEPVDDLPQHLLHFCQPHHRYNPLRYPMHVASQLRAAQRLLREHHFDLLVFRLGVLPLVSRSLVRRHRIPYAIKTLGTGPLEVLHHRGGWLGKALASPNRSMFRDLVAGALVADTDSQGHAAALRQRLDSDHEQIVWIDNGVNTRRFYPGPAAAARRELGLGDAHPVIGYVGSRPWERGGTQLIEAGARLVDTYPGLAIVIVGAGEPVEDMRRRASELGIAERCHFAGYVPYRMIPRYVQSLDVGVSISLPPERAMNSELKVRQYLAAGRPVVISPGSNEFVSEEKLGTVVAPDDIEAITEALSFWLSLPGPERATFERRAAAYMDEHLSMGAMITRRLVLWGERMKRSVQTAPAG